MLNASFANCHYGMIFFVLNTALVLNKILPERHVA